MLREEYDGLTRRLVEETRAFYGSRLVSIVVFGSTAKGTPGPESDVDVLVVVDPLPTGRLNRVTEFGAIEDRLDGVLRSMKEKGIAACLSPVFKTPKEVKAGSPLFLDMTEDGRILFDRDSFMAGYLRELRERPRSLGARRVRAIWQRLRSASLSWTYSSRRRLTATSYGRPKRSLSDFVPSSEYGPADEPSPTPGSSSRRRPRSSGSIPNTARGTAGQGRAGWQNQRRPRAGGISPALSLDGAGHSAAYRSE